MTESAHVFNIWCQLSKKCILANMTARSPQSTAANFYLAKFCELAEASGIEVDDMLARIAIDPQSRFETDVRISANQLGKIVQHICDATHDEGMGLSGDVIPRGGFYALCKLAIQEPTLRRALLAGVRHLGLLTNAVTVKVKAADKHVIFKFKLHQNNRDHNHLFSELAQMSCHRLSCWLIAENIPLQTVYFDYETPAQIAEYAYLFPGNHEFNSGWFGFSIQKEFLNKPVVRDYNALQHFMHDNPAELFLQPRIDFTLSGELKRILNRHFDQVTLPSVDEAAEMVHISRRTLIRRLKKEGTSYQELKDQVRRDRAISRLTIDSLPVAEIAAQVGFADAAAFSRAFKNWTGLSPTEYRAQIGRQR